MTAIPTSEELAEILRDLQELQALGDVVKASGLSEGTVYRHARPEGAENRPANMGRKTVRELTLLFGELGLLDDYDRAQLASAVRRLRALANPSTEDDRRDADLAFPPGDGGGQRKGPA